MSVETRLRREVERMAEEIRPRPDAFVALGTLISRTRRRRIIRGAVASLILAALIAIVVPKVLSSPSADLTSPTDIGSYRVLPRATFDLSGGCAEPSTGCPRPFVYNVTVDFGSAWVNTGTGIARIDLSTNRIAYFDGARLIGVDVDLADFSTAIEDIATGEDAIWFWYNGRHADGVARLDPKTGRAVAEVPLPPPPPLRGHGDRPIAVGEGSVWAINGGNAGGRAAGVLVRIDPVTNQVTGTVDIGTAGPMAIGEGAVWVVSPKELGGRGLLRIDLETLTITEVAEVPDAVALAVGAGAVWVTTSDAPLFNRGELLRIDAKTNRIIARVRLDGGGGPIAVGEQAVWFIDFGSGRLEWLDPRTNRVVGSLGVQTRGPVDLAVGNHTIWITSMNDGIVQRFDIHAS